MPRTVFPEPGPLGWELGAAESVEGDRWLVIRFFHATGETELFLTPAEVVILVGDIGSALERLATEGVEVD